MNDLPEPLVPAEVDLRGYEFMPLYGDRLLGSQTWITCTPEAKVAAVRLWWRAYAKEVPAASLPDDDALLADYAGYGVGVKSWRKVRDQALRGFIKCADGRLYHKVIAPLAIEAFEFRNSQRDRTEKARQARLLHRLSQNKTDGEKPSVTASTGQDRTGHKTLKALSGKPDGAPPESKNGRDYLAESREILDYLNRNTGKAYRPVATNLKLIVARLKSGATALQCREVVHAKCAQWVKDEKMAEYLRPATLFNATKFEQYLGELGGAHG